MKALLLTIAAAGSLLVAAQANAVDAAAAQALAQKSGCLACHSVDKKVLGPAFKDVAAKYKGDKTAEAKMIEKVKKGGSGTWGPMPMPANSPQVKDADIKTVVQWVLSL
ncbi:MAG: c-type cytochrome [Methylotenera sp.]|nr:c-type cytochrome [Methylotenera sp.]